MASGHCQCRNMGGEWPCGAPITQEDLLCDICRGGCNAAARPDDDGQGERYHLRVSGNFTVPFTGSYLFTGSEPWTAENTEITASS